MPLLKKVNLAGMGAAALNACQQSNSHRQFSGSRY
jgi:hypothetical protein